MERNKKKIFRNTSWAQRGDYCESVLFPTLISDIVGGASVKLLVLYIFLYASLPSPYLHANGLSFEWKAM